jgi:hypothetical protein
MKIKSQLLLGAVFGILTSTSAHAQSAPEPTAPEAADDVIVVTGIRASLSNSAPKTLASFPIPMSPNRCNAFLVSRLTAAAAKAVS